MSTRAQQTVCTPWAPFCSNFFGGNRLKPGGGLSNRCIPPRFLCSVTIGAWFPDVSRPDECPTQDGVCVCVIPRLTNPEAMRFCIQLWALHFSFTQWNALQPVWVKLCSFSTFPWPSGRQPGCFIILSRRQWTKRASCGDLHLRFKWWFDWIRVLLCRVEPWLQRWETRQSCISQGGCGNRFETREVNSPLMRMWNILFKMLFICGRFFRIGNEVIFFFSLLSSPSCYCV